uniref:Uncharacterized protein n=1 Tax=Arundo donax TaxID=35708 RepID=A0A0A9I352_ARUDO
MFVLSSNVVALRGKHSKFFHE